MLSEAYYIGDVSVDSGLSLSLHGIGRRVHSFGHGMIRDHCFLSIVNVTNIQLHH